MISTCFRCRTGRNYVPKTQICITRAQSCYPTCFGVREAAGFIFHCKTLGTQRSALEYTQLLPSLLKGPPLQVILFCPRQSRVCRAGNPSQTMPKSHQAEKILEEHWSTEFNQTQRNYRPLSFIDATRESCFASFIQWLTHKHPQQQRLKPQVSPTSTASLPPRHSGQTPACFLPFKFPLWILVNLMSNFHKNDDGWSPGKRKGVVKTIS